MYQMVNYNRLLYLLGDMIAVGKADPERVCSNLRDLWSTLAIVGALMLTLIPFRIAVKCEITDPLFDCASGIIPVNQLHVILSGLSLLGCIAAVAVSTMLYALFGFLSKDGVGEFIQEFPMSIGFPTAFLQVGLVFWILDLFWVALFTHGSQIVLLIVAVFLAAFIGILCVYREMLTFVRRKVTASLREGCPLDP